MVDPRLTQVADLLADILDKDPPDHWQDVVDDLNALIGPEGIRRQTYVIEQRWLRRGVALSQFSRFEDPDAAEPDDVRDHPEIWGGDTGRIEEPTP